jgi:hypothetical protein
VFGTVPLEKNKGLRLRPVINDTNLDNAPIAATHTAPMRESIELGEAEVKKEALMQGIKVIEVNDL